MYFIYFAVYSIRFSEHTNALFSDRNEDIQRLTQARKKILNKINGTCVFAYSGASVRWCALQRTSVAASFDSITFTSLVRFATFDFILISFFFAQNVLATFTASCCFSISRCLCEVCSSLLHSILSVIAKFNIKNIFIFVSLHSNDGNEMVRCRRETVADAHTHTPFHTYIDISYAHKMIFLPEWNNSIKIKL